MEVLIRNIIKQHADKKKKTIETKTIISELKNNGINLYSDPSLNESFIIAVRSCIDNEILKPLGNAILLPQYGKLPHKYYINTAYFESDNEILPSNIVTHLHRRLDTSYYVKHAGEYYKQQDIIHRINDILWQEDLEILTANERAYLIFGDEKAITSPGEAAIDGADIMKKLGGLTLDDIKAKRTYEPFFYIATDKFHDRNDGDKRNILIIENQDTFNTFMDAILNNHLTGVHLLIYGEGNAITRKFEFIQSIHGKLDDNYYYFGDIDPEGISIYHRLKAKFPDYNIHPAVSLYNYMLDKIDPSNAKELRKPQKITNVSVSQFIKSFDDDTRIVINDLIYSHRYLPQEVINKTDMRRLNEIGLH
jgi:hypothetical protein